MYQLSLPGYTPTRPETVKDALTAYFRETHFWRDSLSFDFYNSLKKLKDNNGKSIDDSLELNWYISTLATADHMIDNARGAISVMSDNSADGLLDVLGKNLANGRDKHIRTNIRVISVNETNPERFDEYNKKYGGTNSRVQMSMACVRGPSHEICPFLVCQDYSGFSSLEIKVPTYILSMLPPERTRATFYANGWYPKMYQETFDMYWRKLNNISEPEKPKSLFKRAVDRLLGV
ncbi:Uncharacterised protein [uncultured archaeon]|nr:Uncharacterised protein [uncultured archaeon]